MTPAQSLTLVHLAVIGGVVLVVVGIPLVLLWWQDRDYRRRKQRYAAAKAEDDARWQLYLRHRLEADQRRQEALKQQRRDQPAVTVPVTDGERRERRRILPLETR